MRTFLLFIVFGLLTINSLSQNTEDSLLSELAQPNKNGSHAQIEFQLAKIYYNQYKDSLCEIHLLKSIDVAKKNKKNKIEAIATNMLGNLISGQGKHEKAIQLYKKAIDIAENDDTLKASFMNNYGLELKQIGKYKDAVDVLYKTLNLKEEINASDRSISSTLLNLGLIWDIMNEPKKAMRYYERSLILKKRLNDSLGISRILSNISVIHKNQENLSKALELIKESQQYNRTKNNIEQKYTNHVNLGNIYKKQGNLVLFKSHFDSAFIYASELNNLDYLSDIHQNLGTFYYEQQNYNEAIHHIKKAIDICGENVNSVLLYENHKNLAKTYFFTQEYKLAYQHLEKSNFYRDSIFVIEHQKSIQEISKKYESEKKEKELALKNLELTKTRSIARKRTITILFLSAGIVIVLLLSYIGFRYYREKQRKKLIISEQRLQKYREQLQEMQLVIQSHLNKGPKKMNTTITKEEINHYLIEPLSNREIEILTEIGSGKTNKEIADTVFVSENTVKYHLKNIYLKLDVKNRTEAITKADALNVWDAI